MLNGELRRYVARAGLWLTPAGGTVAFNAVLEVVPELRRKGVARRIYEAEARLYAQWAVDEVQMHAKGDGLVVWIKKFGFTPPDLDQFNERHRRWCALRGRPPATTLLDMPDEYS